MLGPVVDCIASNQLIRTVTTWVSVASNRCSQSPSRSEIGRVLYSMGARHCMVRQLVALSFDV